MSVVINTNFAATLAANNLGASNGLLQRSLNRLSSGSKIVNPADDAGGLAVSMKLSAAARRQGAALGNLGNSVSFLQSQDGVLKAAGKVLERISELKVLSSDPTKNNDDLANYNTEFTALRAQLNSLGQERFNGVALFGTTDMSVGTTEDGTGSIALKGIGLLADGNGTPVAVNLTSSTTTFTPSGPGTLTAGSEGLDFVNTSGTYLLPGESAYYDGNGNWDLPAGYSDITGDTAPDLSSWSGNNENATFTPINVTDTGTVASASSLTSLSLSSITGAIQEIATHRAENGASQSRLGFAAEVLSVNKANLEAANSRITDVDVAEESTALARYNILVQGGTSMLAQANQSAQIALRLLG